MGLLIAQHEFAGDTATRKRDEDQATNAGGGEEGARRCEWSGGQGIRDNQRLGSQGAGKR
jgi:hypothetical protein